MTSGDSGGNQAGAERGPSLGLIRRTEGLRDLATLGITNVWFLGGHDTAGQDPQRSLGNWDHARVLAEAVRIVRMTRPEVILTWLPMQVAGENHGDHQAAAVIANEAFDLAGDPTAFPEQVAAPTQTFEPLLEGLRPWQAKKIYFMSDAIDTQFMEGHGPSYSVTSAIKRRRQAVLGDGLQPAPRARHAVPSAARTAGGDRRCGARADADQRAARRRADRAAALHARQVARRRLTDRRCVRVDHDRADILHAAARISSGDGDGAGHRAWRPVELLRRFWQAHGLDVLTSIDLHEVGPVSAGTEVRIPLVMTNPTTSDQRVSVKTTLPRGLAGEGALFDP